MSQLLINHSTHWGIAIQDNLVRLLPHVQTVVGNEALWALAWGPELRMGYRLTKSSFKCRKRGIDFMLSVHHRKQVPRIPRAF